MKFVALFVIAAVAVIGFIWWNGNTAKPSVSVESSQQTPAAHPQEQTKAMGKYMAADVAKHADRSSCWTIVRGQVFDVTAAIDKHPGGADKILSMCGKDATAQFVGKHGGMEKQEAMLASLVIGTLSENK